MEVEETRERSWVWKKHEKSAAKYRKIVCEDMIRIKIFKYQPYDKNHRWSENKDQTGNGAGFAWVLCWKIGFYG